MAVYHRIAEDLRARIGDGEFDAAPRLPAEHDLAAHYGVARGTVRGALQRLAQQGVVSPRQGSGWTIDANLRTHSFGELRSFAQWAIAHGFVPSGQVLSMSTSPATDREAALMTVDRGTPLRRVVRLRGLDGRLVMLERTTYTPWITPIIDSLDPAESSVLRVLEREYGIVLTSGEHTIDAVAASSEDADLLDVRRGSPLLRVRRDTRGVDGTVVEFSDDRYLPGTVAFQVATTAPDRGLSRTLPRSDLPDARRARRRQARVAPGVERGPLSSSARRARAVRAIRRDPDRPG